MRKIQVTQISEHHNGALPVQVLGRLLWEDATIKIIPLVAASRSKYSTAASEEEEMLREVERERTAYAHK
jgi:hypothetical protein